MFLNLSPGDRVADIQQRRERRHNNSYRVRRRQGGRRQEWRNRTRKKSDIQKSPRTERSDTETDAAGGEEGPSRYKQGHMTNVYLTDSDEEAIVDFVKEYKELYEKTSEHFKDKSREESVWVQFTKSRKLSVKVCKTWFDSQMTHYGKLM